MSKRKDPYLVLGVPRGTHIDDVKRAYRRLVLALHPDHNQNAGTGERLRDVQRAYEALQQQEPGVGSPHDGPDGDLISSTDEGGTVPVHRKARAAVETMHEPEPLTYSAWRHGVRFHPEPFATAGAEQLASRTRRVFTELDERLGGMVPEIFPNRPASVEKDLFVEVILTEHEARVGGTFPLTIPIQKQCQACLGSGLGDLTRHCTTCKGRGYHVERKDLELVVPPGVHDGQQTEMSIATEGAPVMLRVLVRVA